MKTGVREQEAGVRGQESAVNVKPLANAEIQIGWTALVEAFSNHWHGCGMSAEEINIYVGVSAREFLKVGWLREEKRAAGHLFWPAGPLLDELNRQPEPEHCIDCAPEFSDCWNDIGACIKRPRTVLRQPDTCNLHPETVHVSTYPTPHIVDEFPASHPTTPERSTARQAQSGSSQTAMTESAAIGLGVQTDAAASAPSTVARRGGRWDANPVQIPVAPELAYALGVLQVASQSIRECLDEQIDQHNQHGRPTADELEQAVNRLMATASDLHRHLLDVQVDLQRARFQSRFQKA